MRWASSILILHVFLIQKTKVKNLTKKKIPPYYTSEASINNFYDLLLFLIGQDFATQLTFHIAYYLTMDDYSMFWFLFHSYFVIFFLI